MIAFIHANFIISILVLCVLFFGFLWFHVYMVTEGNAAIREWLWDTDRNVYTMVVMIIPVYAVCIFFWTFHLIMFMIAANALVELIKGNR